MARQCATAPGSGGGGGGGGLTESIRAAADNSSSRPARRQAPCSLPGNGRCFPRGAGRRQAGRSSLG